MNKSITEPTEAKKICITIQYVFRASFNDTYWIEEKTIDPSQVNRECPIWFDPYNGNSVINDTEIAISYLSDEEAIVLERKNGEIKEHTIKGYKEVFLCEDFNESRLLAAHIGLR